MTNSRPLSLRPDIPGLSCSAAKVAFDASPSYLTARAYAMAAVEDFNEGSINRYQLAAVLNELESYLKGAA